MKRLLASAILPACTAAALAQTPCPLPDNCVTNPSFELVDPFSAAGPGGVARAVEPQ